MFIVATISKNSYASDKIEEILRAGATILRYNFSHGTPEQMQERIADARKVIRKLKLVGKVKILADLPGDKIRMGNFPTGHFDVEKGMPVTFKSAENSEDPNLFIPVEYPKIASYVKIGQEFSLMDGEVGFRVTKIVSDDKFVAEAVNKWHISALKGVNLGRSIDELEHITEKTVAHLKELHKINPEWVAFSFVNSGQFAKKTRRLLKDISTPSWQPKLVAKVETEKGVKNIDDISAVVDVVLVARGDLGLAMPYEKLGISQKKIVLSARKHKKLVIVSTQILDSLLSYFVPSRAEVLDLTNIILDGADGIMLAKETGISLTPGFSVNVAKKIIDSVEKSKNFIWSSCCRNSLK